MKEDFEDWYARQERLGLIACGAMFVGCVAIILISKFLNISIPFK